MLRELHIKNLALIQDAQVELTAGLNVFTGATGAGKSLVLGALELLLGGRANVQMVRPGAAEARVGGVFEVRDPAARARVAGKLETEGWEADQDLILSRRFLTSGRNTYGINGSPVTATLLREVASLLVDIHGQHEHQLLLVPSHQLEMLDDFADGGAQRKAFADAYARRRELVVRREELLAGAAARRQQLELFAFQSDEIDGAELQEGEVESLESERRRLANVEKLRREAAKANRLLAETESNLLEQIKKLASKLDDLAELDDRLEAVAGGVRSAAAELGEAAPELAAYLEDLQFDPDRLAEVDDRLYRVKRLIDKYGGTLEATLEFRRSLDEKSNALQAETSDLAGLDAKLAEADKGLLELGARLRDIRVKAARKMGKAVEKELADLGMENARFEAVFDDAAIAVDRMGPTGFDSVELVIAPNPGQPPHPLRKIASGGELSRVMLAVKGILAEADRVSVLIFDEVDSNIGGRLGDMIGTKLRKLARSHQVLCITHMPQIAAFADRQFTVRKQVVKGESVTTVAPVEGDARLSEIAEMISGKQAGPTTRKQAAEMLEAAKATEKRG